MNKSRYFTLQVTLFPSVTVLDCTLPEHCIPARWVTSIWICTYVFLLIPTQGHLSTYKGCCHIALALAYRQIAAGTPRPHDGCTVGIVGTCVGRLEIKYYCPSDRLTLPPIVFPFRVIRFISRRLVTFWHHCSDLPDRRGPNPRPAPPHFLVLSSLSATATHETSRPCLRTRKADGSYIRAVRLVMRRAPGHHPATIQSTFLRRRGISMPLGLEEDHNMS